MPWFRCDDQLADHPKVMALGDRALPAMGLWLLCGVYCSKRLTDGFVPKRAVHMLGGDRLAKDLERTGLFEKAEGGWQMHDYLEWNPSHAEVDRQRAERVAAGMAGAKARWLAEPMAGAIAEAKQEPKQQARQTDAPVPVPVSQVLENVLGNGVPAEEYVNPSALYLARSRHKKLSEKEANWIEDLHARFSRQELVTALRVVDRGRDYLKRVDGYLEGGGLERLG